MKTTGKEALLSQLEYSYRIDLNANDTFFYASAMSVTLAADDYEWALPMIEKYGYDGAHAVMSYITKLDVLPQLQNESYLAAKKELEESQPDCDWSRHLNGLRPDEKQD